MKNEKKYEKKCLLPTDAVLYKAKIIQSVDRKTNTAHLTFALVVVQCCAGYDYDYAAHCVDIIIIIII